MWSLSEIAPRKQKTKQNRYIIKFRPQDLACYLLDVDISWEPNFRIPDLGLEAPDNQAVRQSPPSVPALLRLEDYHLDPGLEREDPHFFKMLLAFFSYFSFSFVILMNNLSSKLPVTPKEKSSSTKGKNDFWKMVGWIFHIPKSFSHDPLAFSRHMSLKLSWHFDNQLDSKDF